MTTLLVDKIISLLCLCLSSTFLKCHKHISTTRYPVSAVVANMVIDYVEETVLSVCIAGNEMFMFVLQLSIMRLKVSFSI